MELVRYENELYVQVFQTLVDAEGHLDMMTPEGKTVISILKESVRENSYVFGIDHQCRPTSNLLLCPSYPSAWNSIQGMSTAIHSPDIGLPSQRQQFTRMIHSAPFPD
jgi:hypothetical protein